MRYDNEEAYEANAKVIKALGHPSRLMIVDFLGEGPRCVCEIRDMVGSDQSTVSKHLSVLRNAGIVKSEKKGLQVYYKLRCPCVINFIQCIEDVVKADFEEMFEIFQAK
ncbi:MAG: ArsR/SmtB family transcription factor [Sedimentisphaeraceae bacterium JB056]